MRVLYANEAHEGHVLTSSSAAVGFPVTNLENYLVSDKWRATGDADEWIKFDAGSGNTITVTDCAINGHNFSSGATVKIQGNATDVWTAPTIDETITFNAGVMYKQFTGGSYQYWRLSIVDSSNPDTYVELGILFIGEDLNLGDIYDREYPIQNEDTSIRHFTRTGQMYGDKGIIRDIYVFSLPHVDDEKSDIEAWFDAVGMWRSWFLIIEPTDLTNFPIQYMAFNENLDWNHIIGTIYNLNFACIEVF